MNLQDIPFIARVRRNHGLEHATIHILAQQNPRLNVVGRTTPGGFYLYGNLTTKQVRAAVEQAISRLQKEDFHNFTLTVINLNDPPEIQSDNKTNILEDERYSVYYQAVDNDDDTLFWYMESNSGFLSFSPAILA